MRRPEGSRWRGTPRITRHYSMYSHLVNSQIGKPVYPFLGCFVSSSAEGICVARGIMEETMGEGDGLKSASTDGKEADAGGGAHFVHPRGASGEHRVTQTKVC